MEKGMVEYRKVNLRVFEIKKDSAEIKFCKGRK